MLYKYWLNIILYQTVLNLKKRTIFTLNSERLLFIVTLSGEVPTELFGTCYECCWVWEVDSMKLLKALLLVLAVTLAFDKYVSCEDDTPVLDIGKDCHYIIWL
jgi:hypothetical protein